jgi:hypothetical protein
MDHLDLAIQRHPATSVSTQYFDKDRSMNVSGGFLNDKKPREMPTRGFLPHSTGEISLRP